MSQSPVPPETSVNCGPDLQYIKRKSSCPPGPISHATITDHCVCTGSQNKEPQKHLPYAAVMFLRLHQTYGMEGGNVISMFKLVFAYPLTVGLAVHRNRYNSTKIPCLPGLTMFFYCYNVYIEWLIVNRNESIFTLFPPFSTQRFSLLFFHFLVSSFAHNRSSEAHNRSA